MLNLAKDWLNPGPTDQLKQGLPPGFRERTTRHEFGGIIVHLAGRYDQICFKLYAAADSDPGSKHVKDLIDLDPSPEEMRDAAAWVKEQDTGVEFASFVDQSSRTWRRPVRSDKAPLIEASLNLAWSHWGALGIRGMTQPPNSAVDPEALLYLTACLAEYDPAPPR